MSIYLKVTSTNRNKQPVNFAKEQAVPDVSFCSLLTRLLKITCCKWHAQLI